MGLAVVFPAARLCVHEESGQRRRHDLHETVLQQAVRRAALAVGFGSGPAHPPPLLRQPSPRGRQRHPHRPGAARAQGRSHERDLHSRPRSWPHRHPQPHRPSARRLIASAAHRGSSTTPTSTVRLRADDATRSADPSAYPDAAAGRPPQAPHPLAAISIAPRRGAIGLCRSRAGLHAGR